MYDGTLKELWNIIKDTLKLVRKKLKLFFKTVLFWVFALAPLIGGIALVPLTEKYWFMGIIIIALFGLEVPWGYAVKELVDVHK